MNDLFNQYLAEARRAGWELDTNTKTFRAPAATTERITVTALYTLWKSLVLADSVVAGLGGAFRQTPEPFPIAFALGEGWSVERPELLRGADLFDSDGHQLVTSSRPRRVAYWEIDQFRRAREVTPLPLDADSGLVMKVDGDRREGEDRFVSEATVKHAINTLLGEPYALKDSPDERHDVYSARVLLHGHEIDGAFLLKGPGIASRRTKSSRELTPALVDKHGTQVQRLFESQPASLFVVQYVGKISRELRKYVEEEAERTKTQDVKVCFIDGADTAHLLGLAGEEAT